METPARNFRVRRYIAGLLALALVFGALVQPAYAQSKSSAIGVATPPTGYALVRGIVRDQNQGPLANAAVGLAGPANYNALSDAAGAFSISSVTPGLYQITVTHAGFQTQVITDYAIVADQSYDLSVGLAALSLNSIREIGRVVVSANRRGQLNVSAAASDRVSAATFAEQDEHQIIHVLDQQPGYITAHESANGNPSGPGAAQYPNIRGALTYETASIIDGHPVARSQGGYRSQYLDPTLFQAIEVVKGPGATVPNINYAIGGAVNFRTMDPTSKPQGYIDYGSDNFGGHVFDFKQTGTTLNGRLGYAIVWSDNGSNGGTENFPTRIPLIQYTNVGAPNGSGSYYINTAPIKAGPATTSNGIPIQNPNSTGSTTVYACCVTVNNYLQDTAELVKLRYKLSNSTTVTGTYLGTHGKTDENGNHLWQDSVLFNPANGPGGGQLAFGDAAAGSNVNLDTNYVPPTQLRNQNEPIYMLDLRTAIKNDTILARYFAAVTDNIAGNGLSDPGTSSATQMLNVYGTFTGCAAGYAPASATCLGPTSTVTYNGQLVPVTYGPSPTGFFVCYEPGSKYTPPGGRYNGSYDPTCTRSSPNYAGWGGSPGNNGGTGATTGPLNAYFQSYGRDALQGGSFEYDHYVGSNVFSISAEQTKTNIWRNLIYVPQGITDPKGTFNLVRAIMGRASIDITPKLNAITSLYLNHYQNHLSPDNGFTWLDTQYNHFDARLGLTYRPNSSASLRLAIGSSIAPPYMDLLNAALQPDGIGVGSALPTCSGGECSQTIGNPNLAPETAFGANIGGSFRMPDGVTVLDIDLYRTNLFNQFINARYLNGTYTPPGGVAQPLYTTQWTNIANARYDGFELTLKRDPPVGFGYTASLAMQHDYPYNLPGNFYGCTVANLAPGTPCPVSGYNTNLAVVPGVNYLVPCDGTGVNQGCNGIARNNIPYAQGYGELSYRSERGGLLAFGATYYGPNNSFNQLPFFVFNGSASLTLGNRRNTVQFDIYNVFNVLNLPYVIQGGGLPVPLVNSKLGLTNAEFVGPRKFSVLVKRSFGGQ